MMDFLSIKDQRKAALEILKPFLTVNHFEHKEHTLVDLFVKKMNFGFVTFQFRFRRSECIEFQFWMSFVKVEELMMLCGFPDADMDRLVTMERYQLQTVKNSKIDLGYNYRDESITSVHQVERFSNSLKNYLERDGFAFIERYSNLLNVLDEMNRLEDHGMNWNGLYGENGILTGGLRAFLRGLAISKICNDNDYNRKLELVYNIFKDETEWLGSYNKLKNVLSQLK